VTLTQSERATLRRSVGDSARGPQANSSERLESAGCLRPHPAHEDPRSTSVNRGSSAVREGGLEPPCPLEHTDLNRARLPIPPLARNFGTGNSTHQGRRFRQSTLHVRPIPNAPRLGVTHTTS